MNGSFSDLCRISMQMNANHLLLLFEQENQEFIVKKMMKFTTSDFFNNYLTLSSFYALLTT